MIVRQNRHFFASTLCSLTLALVPGAALAAPQKAPPHSAGTSAIPPESPAPEPSSATVAPGPDPWFTLFATGEVVGFIEDCGCPHNPGGGLARRAGYAKLFKEAFKTSPALYVDAGNWSELDSPAGLIKTRTILEAMTAMGYVASNISERELANGYEAFAQLKKFARFPFVSSNMVFMSTGKPIVEPYTIVTLEPRTYKALKKPLRVAVLGATRFNPMFLKAKTDPPADKVIIAPPSDELKKYVPELKKKSDQIVLLASMTREDAHLLAKEVPGIDVIISAAGAFTTLEEKEGNTSIVFVGNEGKNLAELRVFHEGAGPAQIKTKLNYLDSTYAEDGAMRARVDAAKVEIDAADPTAAAQVSR